MKSIRGGLLCAAACVALAACHFPGGGAKQPTGQVVATVGDREITQRDLQAELGSAKFPDPATRKQAEKLALNNIIGRIILANEAKARGLDKSPDFAVQKQRAIDNVLAQSLQAKVVSEVPQPSSDEVQAFVNGHADIFLERKIFAVDQIRMARPTDPSVIKALEPLKTLESVEALLKTSNVRYQRNTGTLDTVGTDPRIVDLIVKLPPGEIFVLPNGETLLVAQIKQTTVTPFTGEPALAYAKQVILRQRTQETLARTFRDLMTKAAKQVRLNKDFAPTKAANPAGPPASAPPANAPAG